MRPFKAIGSVLAFGACLALVQSAGADNRKGGRDVVWARLIGLQEVPAVLTPARGWFRATIDEDARTIEYSLSYEKLEGAVTMAHLHVGQHHVNGGISVWLCGTTALPGPSGTPACPSPEGRVEGTAGVAAVVGPVVGGAPAQGFVPMTEEGFDDLVRAIRSGVVYANVHSSIAPGGEIRGQIGR